MKVIDLSKESFVERVSEFQQYPEGWNFKGDKPCVVDFHAPWCVYCKALSPVLDQLAEEYDGKIDFYKVDVDQEPELESAFKIRIGNHGKAPTEKYAGRFTCRGQKVVRNFTSPFRIDPNPNWSGSISETGMKKASAASSIAERWSVFSTLQR